MTDVVCWKLTVPHCKHQYQTLPYITLLLVFTVRHCSTCIAHLTFTVLQCLSPALNRLRTKLLSSLQNWIDKGILNILILAFNYNNFFPIHNHDIMIFIYTFAIHKLYGSATIFKRLYIIYMRMFLQKNVKIRKRLIHVYKK